MPKSASRYFQRQMQKAKATEFQPVQGFEFGYRNREDVTTLNPKVMVKGSQNILTSVKGTFGNRKGYVLDGPANKDGHPVVSSYDWTTNQTFERNLRFTNGNLQFRYINPTTGAVTWQTFFTSTGKKINFAEFWDDNATASAEELSMLLFVDGSSNIFSWTGGVGTISATSANSLTLAGGGTWADSGFLFSTSYARNVVINGHTYAYTGGATTGTLTGVTGDPTGEANGSLVYQAVVTTPNSALIGNGGVGTAIPTNFKNTLIASQDNQVYISSKDSFTMFKSKFNNFRDYSYTSPTRGVGDGAQFTFKGVPTAIITQDSDVYVSVAKDYWYRISFVVSIISTGSATESASKVPLKNGPLQASQSQALTTKIKNKVAFLSFEPIVNTLAIDQNILLVPQMNSISDSIVNDISSYDFTGGSMKFYQNNLYLSAPVESIVLIYNMTQEDIADAPAPKHYWECPQVLPVGRFAIIGGQLYGHSSTDGETYRLFVGFNDNGHRYKSRAVFAYDSHGSRNLRKSSDELFVEGYIQPNTTVTASLRRELGGSVATLPVIEGTNTDIVSQIIDDASLGKEPLGKIPLGSSLATLDGVPDIPKFRAYLTYPRTPFFEEQVSFEVDGVDQRFEIVSFASNASPTTEEPTDIKQ